MIEPLVEPTDNRKLLCSDSKWEIRWKIGSHSFTNAAEKQGGQ